MPTQAFILCFFSWNNACRWFWINHYPNSAAGWILSALLCLHFLCYRCHWLKRLISKVSIFLCLRITKWWSSVEGGNKKKSLIPKFFPLRITNHKIGKFCWKEKKWHHLYSKNIKWIGNSWLWCVTASIVAWNKAREM